MVSIRCKLVVKAALEKLGLHYGMIDLGEVEVMESKNKGCHRGNGALYRRAAQNKKFGLST